MTIPLAREIDDTIHERTPGWLLDVALSCLRELWRRKREE